MCPPRPPRLHLRRRTNESRPAQLRTESLETFAAGIAHDFNNLLLGITGNVEMVLRNLPPDDPSRDRLQQALGAAQRATTLTKQMLAYSGKGRFVMQPVNLSQLLETHATDPALRVVPDPRLPAVQGDPDQLAQVIGNLIVNARESGGA